MPASPPEEAVVIPPPSIDEKPASTALEKAVFAGGCFWGVQGVFQHVDGVTGAVSGYAGGEQSTADYATVGTGRTGHAESVEVTFDPAKISYGKLLQVFFSVAHNPDAAQLPGTGPWHAIPLGDLSAELRSRRRLQPPISRQLDQAKLFEGKIVTTLEGAKAFYPAEDYHQDFLTLNPTIPTSSTTTCRRSRTSSGCSRISIARSRCW